MAELEKQLKAPPTRGVAGLSWGNNGIVYLAESREEAVKPSGV
jgi:sulfopropanediol 3-dehydrogenase